MNSDPNQLLLRLALAKFADWVQMDIQRHFLFYIDDSKNDNNKNNINNFRGTAK